MREDPLLLAVVGMPGAGKSEVVNLLKEKGFPAVRFGDETDRGLTEVKLPLTEDNERIYREKLRKTLGMAAYAIAAKPKIDKLIGKNKVILLDGLYSWEEYIYLRKHFPTLVVICVFANSQIRHSRLLKRQIRPLTLKDARKRDIDEIEKLNKGGPIAAADYFVDNNDTKEELKKKINALLQNLSLA